MRDAAYFAAEFLENVHDAALCAGRPCVIHNPSDHHMRDWPLVWRGDDPFDIKPGHFERTCPHRIGHPDPDCVAYDPSLGVHGCDGCCAEKPEGSPLTAGVEVQGRTDDASQKERGK